MTEFRSFAGGPIDFYAVDLTRTVIDLSKEVIMSRTKKPLIAGILNFILPGLGLLYIGHKKGALINFVLVNVILVLVTFVFADPQIVEHVHWVFLGLAALSAGYAHGVAVSEERAQRRRAARRDYSVALTPQEALQHKCLQHISCRVLVSSLKGFFS